jgi:type I restriction enzyme S subunit
VLKAAVEGELTEDWREQHPDVEPASQLLQRILAERRRRWEEDQLAKYKAKGAPPPSGWKAKYREPSPPVGSGLPSAPQHWCRATVAQLAEVGTGATPNRGMKARYYEGGSIPWVTSACVNASLVQEPAALVTAAAMSECNLTLYPVGTLLLAMYGEGKTRGKCAELAIESTTNQALAAIQRLGALGPYVKLFLRKHYQELRRVASGGVQPNLNLERVREIEVPIPPSPNKKPSSNSSKTSSPSSTTSKPTSTPSWRPPRRCASRSCVAPSRASWCRRTRTTSRRPSC